VIANIVFHDLVATPTPHNLLDYHRPHNEGKRAGAIKEEMAVNVKQIVGRTLQKPRRGHTKNTNNN